MAKNPSTYEIMGVSRFIGITVFSIGLFFAYLESNTLAEERPWEKEKVYFEKPFRKPNNECGYFRITPTKRTTSLDVVDIISDKAVPSLLWLLNKNSNKTIKIKFRGRIFGGAIPYLIEFPKQTSDEIRKYISDGYIYNVITMSDTHINTGSEEYCNMKTLSSEEIIRERDDTNGSISKETFFDIAGLIWEVQPSQFVYDKRLYRENFDRGIDPLAYIESKK